MLLLGFSKTSRKLPLLRNTGCSERHVWQNLWHKSKFNAFSDLLADRWLTGLVRKSLLFGCHISHGTFRIRVNMKNLLTTMLPSLVLAPLSLATLTIVNTRSISSSGFKHLYRKIPGFFWVDHDIVDIGSKESCSGLSHYHHLDISWLCAWCYLNLHRWTPPVQTFDLTQSLGSQLVSEGSVFTGLNIQKNTDVFITYLTIRIPRHSKLVTIRGTIQIQ